MMQEQNTDNALPGGMPSNPETQPNATQVTDDVFNAAVFTGEGIEQDDPFANMALPAGGETTQAIIPDEVLAQAQTTQPVQTPTQQQLTPEVAAEIEQARQFMPLLRFIQQDPDLIALIDKKVSGQTQPAPVVAEKLVAPQKPANYNPQEAVQNPESESWKYREAMEEYRTKSIDVLRSEIQKRDEMAQQQQRAQEAKERQRQQLSSVIREAVSQHGLTQEQVPDFVQVMSNPKNVTVASMVALYNIIKGGVPQRTMRQTAPRPGGSGGSGGATIIDVNMNDAFNKSVRAWSK